MSTEICKLCEEESMSLFATNRTKGYICIDCYHEILEMISQDEVEGCKIPEMEGGTQICKTCGINAYQVCGKCQQNSKKLIRPDSFWYICNECYDEAIIEGLRNSWISVKDRLPELIEEDSINQEGIFTQQYVLTTDGKFMNVCFCSVSSHNYVFMIDSVRQFTNVTHWMPLPEIPK